ncbi:MAG: methyltransferase domain-containing protein, partial [Devosiaceae bacterium]|nr:methyltransferase domain-containing protein [Devosiaceae bacterium]
MTTLTDHWNKIFQNTDEEKLGWHEDDYAQTLKLLSCVPGWENSKILIPGVGTSGLADILSGTNAKLVLNDISSEAIEKVKLRLSDKEHDIRWLCRNVSEALPRDIVDIDIWIDRAVLHFLIDDSAIDGYFQNVHTTVKMGGYALFAEFSKNGATRCPGLDVRRYDLADL